MAKTIRILLFWLVLCPLLIPMKGIAAERGVVQVSDEAGREVGLYDGSYALVIGVSHYAGGWPSLPGVDDDVRAVKKALERHGFIVKVVKDPDQAELEAAYKNFINEYGLNKNNRLLFYFAGHGFSYPPAYAQDSDPEEWIGSIVSKNAPLPETDPIGLRNNTMNMQRFEEHALSIEAKHALFIFDSCFSGSVFAITRSIPDAISAHTMQPVRQFITAGNASQKVPDASIFRRQFVAALEGEADLTGDGYVTGTELGLFLNERVTNYSKGAQTPQYGKIRNPRLDKGNYVFVLPNAKAPSFTLNYLYRPGGTGDLRKLASGAVLKSGDHYKIAFTPDEDAYVYIYQADSRGQIFQLFPMTEFGGVRLENDNPVKKGRQYTLPAPDKAFVLDDTTGRESFYFLASRGPKKVLERLSGQLRAAQQHGLPEQAATTSAEVRGYMSRQRGLASIVPDNNAGSSRYEVPWEEGKTFAVFKDKLNSLCPACVLKTEFEHR